MADRSRYSAPALEKGLDILELLAGRFEPLSQAAIAQALGRTPSEIFRMVAVMERRGYVTRGPGDDLYRLSPRLFELSNQHPPSRRLIDAAIPIMHRLAADLFQSCHLAVRFAESALVIAQVDPPGFIGLSVRVGARAPLLDTCSGLTLLAFRPHWEQERGLAEFGVEAGSEEETAAEARLAKIRRTGRTRVPSLVTRGVTDLAAPILDHMGCAQACLTVPYLERVAETPDLEHSHERIQASAAEIADILGGHVPVPSNE